MSVIRPDQAGMQNSQIEPVRNGGRIIRYHILLFGLIGEAASMNRHSKIFKPSGFRLFVRQHHGVAARIHRQSQLAGHVVCRVVITRDQIQTDSRFTELVHLSNEEHAGVEISPVAIVQVPGDNDEIDSFTHRECDEVLESSTSRTANQIDRSTFVTFQSF